LEGFCSTIELHPLKFSPKPSLRPNPFIALEDRPHRLTLALPPAAPCWRSSSASSTGPKFP